MNSTGRSPYRALLLSLTTAAALALALPAGAAPSPARAVATPAESTRVLPDVSTISSAVDNAGGSLVVGHSLHGRGPGIRAYYRTPSGTWHTSVLLLPEASFPGTLVETAAAGGPSGVYVIAWTFTRGSSRTVYVSVRSSTGAYSAPRLVLTSGSDAADARLRVSTNEHGDAVITERDPDEVVRYTRNTGKFRGYFLPREDGEGPGSGLHKRDAVATMSSAGTIDITYGFPAGTDASPQLSIVQQTLAADTVEFTRRVIATASSRTASFDIAMDGNGVQTLITNDGHNHLYREQTRRGPFVQRVEEVDAASTGAVPHVAARGDFNRIDYVEYCDCDGEFNLTASRLYRGDEIVNGGSGTSSGATGTDDVQRAMAIGLGGRGVEVTFGTRTVNDSSISESTVQRSVLGDPGRTDQIMSRGSLEAPALDVGRTSVSQLVVHEAVRSGGKTVRRTVVYVRR